MKLTGVPNTVELTTMTTTNESSTYILPLQPSLLGNEEVNHQSLGSMQESELGLGASFLFSSVRALRDFVQRGLIVPHALQTEANRCHDGSHVVSGKLVWSIPGQHPIPKLAARTGRMKAIPVLIDVEPEWQPPVQQVQRIQHAQDSDGDAIEVLVSDGVLPLTAIRAVLVEDHNAADNLRTVFPDYGNEAGNPAIRVIPGLFTGPLKPLASDLDLIAGAPEIDHSRRLVASLHRIIGAASLAATALPNAPTEVAKQFSDLVSFGLSAEQEEVSNHASFGAAIGAELAIRRGGLNVRPLADVDADVRLITAAVRLISKVSPPSNYVPLEFIQDLRDALSEAEESSSGLPSRTVSSLGDLVAALRNELDWDVAWNKIHEPSLQAVALVAHASNKYESLSQVLDLSPVSPEATLLAYALWGCLHRLTGIPPQERPSRLVNVLAEAGARIITGEVAGHTVSDVSVRLDVPAGGEAVATWRLMVGDQAAHSWIGRESEIATPGHAATEAATPGHAATEAATPGHAATEDATPQHAAAVVPGGNASLSDGTPEDVIAPERWDVEFAAHRADDQVDEGVRHLIKLASIREAACVRLREARYLGRADERQARHDYDDADLQLERQLARLLEEYAERRRLLGAFEADRQTREPRQD